MGKAIWVFIKLSLITMLTGLVFILVIFLRGAISGNPPDMAILTSDLSGNEEQQVEQAMNLVGSFRNESIGMMNDLPYSSFFMPFMYKYNLVGIDMVQMHDLMSMAQAGGAVNPADITEILAKSTGKYVAQTNIWLDIAKGLVIAVFFSLFGGLFRRDKKSVALTFFRALTNFSIILIIAVFTTFIFNRVSLLGEAAKYVLALLSASGTVTAMILMIRKKCSKLEVEFKLSTTVGDVLVDGIIKPLVRTIFMIFSIVCFINAYLGSSLRLQLAVNTASRTDIGSLDLVKLNFSAGAMPMAFVVGIIGIMVLMDLLDNKLRTKLQVTLSAKSDNKTLFPQAPSVPPSPVQYPQVQQPYPTIQPPPQVHFPQPVPPSKIFCTQCGAALPKNALYCAGCGTKAN